MEIQKILYKNLIIGGKSSKLAVNIKSLFSKFLELIPRKRGNINYSAGFLLVTEIIPPSVY